MMRLDARDRVANGARHARPRAFGGRADAPLAAAKAHSARELACEKAALGRGLLGASGVVHPACLFEVVLDFGEAAPVGLPGALVEHGAGITWTCARSARSIRANSARLLALFLDDEVERVPLAARVGEQAREIAHPLGVAHPRGVPVEGERPVLALARERVAGRARGDGLRRWRTRRRRGAGRVRAGLRQQRRRHPERSESLAGGVHFDRGGHVIAAGGERAPEQQARRCRLAGRPNPAPLMDGGSKALRGALGIAERQPHTSLCDGRSRLERRTLDGGGDARQLVGRPLRSRDVADGDCDLDVCFEQRRLAEVRVRGELLGRDVHRVIERRSDQRRRHRRVPARQVQQREPGLRIPSGVLGRGERLLGAFEIALAKADASELGQRPSELATEIGPQLLARAGGFRLGVAVGAPQPEDLRPVETTAPVDAADGAALRPVLHGRRPLLGEVVLRDRLQCAHDFAVDDARRQRIDLAGDGGDRGFVQQIDAAGDLAREDDASRFGDAAHRGRGGVVHGANRDRPLRPLGRSIEVAREQPFVAANDGEPGVDGGVLVPGEQPLGTRRPAADGREQRRVEEHVQGDARGRRGGVDAIVAPERFGMRALPRVDRHVDVTGRIGRGREQAEVGSGHARTGIEL